MLLSCRDTIWPRPSTFLLLFVFSSHQSLAARINSMEMLANPPVRHLFSLTSWNPQHTGDGGGEGGRQWKKICWTNGWSLSLAHSYSTFKEPLFWKVYLVALGWPWSEPLLCTAPLLTAVIWVQLRGSAVRLPTLLWTPWGQGLPSP